MEEIKLILTCPLPYTHLLSSIWRSEDIPYYWPVSYRTNICCHPSDDLRTSLTTDLSATLQTSVVTLLMIWGHPILLTCQPPYKHLLSSIWWSEDTPYYWHVNYRTNICCHPSDDLRTSRATDLSATVHTSVAIHLTIWGPPLLLTCQLPYKHLFSSFWWSEDIPYYWPVSHRTNICCHPSDDLRTPLTTDLSATVQTSVAIHRMIWGHPLLLTCQLPYKHLLSSIWWSEDIPYWPVSHRINICCHPSDDLRTSLSDLSATVQTFVVIHLMIWGHPLLLTCQLPYKHLSPSIWWSEDIPYYWPVSYRTHICCHPSDDLMTSLTDLSATVQTSVAIHLMIWGHPLLLTCQLPYKHLLPSIGRSEDIPYYWPVSYRTNICYHPSDDLRTSLTTDLSATVQTSVTINRTIWGHPLLLTCQPPYKHLLPSIWWSEDIPYYWPVSYRTHICCHPSDDLRTSLTTDLSATVQTSVTIHLMIWGHPLLLTCQLPYTHLLSSIWRSEDIPYYWPVSHRTNICCHPSDDLRTPLTTDMSTTVQTSVVIHLMIWGHPVLLTCQPPYTRPLPSIWRSEDLPYYWPVSYRTNICFHPSDDLRTSLTTDLSVTVQTSVVIHLMIWGHPLLLTCQLPYKHLLPSIGWSEDIPYYWPVSYRTNICCHLSDDLRTSLTDLSATV